MATGFIYVVASATNYQQPSFCNVPTQWEGRLYFGPCMIAMRPRMRPGDFVFGISPSQTKPRRVLFAASIEECITFREAYARFPALHGPEGPIHVRPVSGTGPFPGSDYQHIPRAMHPDKWEADLKTKSRDRFFVCGKSESEGWVGSWLGAAGPAVDEEILHFLNTCFAYASDGYQGMNTGTLHNPVACNQKFRIYLETANTETLLALCAARMKGVTGWQVDPPPPGPGSCHRSPSPGPHAGPRNPGC